MKLLNYIKFLFWKVTDRHGIDLNAITKALEFETTNEIFATRNYRFRNHYNHSTSCSLYSSIKYDSNIFFRIRISLEFINDKTKKVNEVIGVFDPETIKQHTFFSETRYYIKPVINIYNWDTKTDLRKEINAVLKNEVHKIYNHTKNFYEKGISKSLNNIKNEIRTNKKYIDKYKDHRDIKDFMDLFYLNLPEEQDARINQVYKKMLYNKDKSIDDMIINCENLSSFEDFKAMLQFKSKYISAPLEFQKEFIKDFDEILKNNNGKYKLSDIELNYPKEPSEFFEFWIKKFYENVECSRERIVELAHEIKGEKVTEDSYMKRSYECCVALYHIEYDDE